MQFLAILIPGLCIVLGAVLLLKWAPDRQRTFSEHVADNKWALAIFMLLFPLMTVAYYYFLAAWFGPNFNMPAIYYWLLGAAFISQLVFTWIPARKGRMVRLHTGFALVTTSVMMLIAVLILANAEIQQDAMRVALSIAYLVLSVLIFVSYFLRRRIAFVRRNLFALEMIFFLLFWTYVALLTHL
jgi:hypothetical protein